MQASMQDKQKFLRSEILQSGVDPESFMAFMGTVKQEGQSINLQNWNLQQLKEVVQQFKKSLQEEIKRAKKQNIQSRNSKEAVTNKIMASLVKKDKVFYDRDDLWDYQMYTQQECRRIQKVFEFKSDPEIDYKSWQIKKTGGFLFGIGSKNQLEITFITNFTSDTVVRKSQDVDWLRQTLCAKYPGSFIPPLQQTKFIEPEDKIGIMRRIKQIILFLNSVVNFKHLVQNKYFYQFIADKDPRSFNSFKSKQTAVRTAIDISSIENLEGKFTVEISKRVLSFIKQSSQFGRTADQIYFGMQANLKKMMGDLQTLTKHTHYIANDFAKFNQKFNKMSQKCQLSSSSTGQKIGNIFAYLNNMFTNMGNQFKKQMQCIRQVTEDFIRYTHSQWSEYLLHEKKFNNEMNNYLTTKFNLIKKKQRNLNDVSKWELDEKEMFRMSRVNTAKMDREEAFQIMFPRDNRVEEEMRIWQAYINDMYEKTFKILINQQQKQYLKYFGRFCTKMQKLSQEQRQMHQRFKQIFGSSPKNELKQTQIKQ